MERSVQGLLAQGKRASDIAKIMGVSPNYVHRLRRSIRTRYASISGARATNSGTGATVAPAQLTVASAPHPHLGTPLALSDPTPDSSPTPDSQRTPIRKARKKKTSSELVADPLFAPLKDAFVSQSPNKGRDWNWRMQGPNINGLLSRARKYDDPEGHLSMLLETFLRLTQSADKFWCGQPFTPSTLNSEAIYTRVCREMEGQRSIVDEVVGGMR